VRGRLWRTRLGLVAVAVSLALLGTIVISYSIPSFARASRVSAASHSPTSGVRNLATPSPSVSSTAPGTPSPSISPAEAAPQVPPPPLKVLTIGDSIMKGFGLSTTEAWPELIASQDKWSLTTLACNGAGFLAIGNPNDCDDNFPAIVKSAAALQPDVVIISGSSNDFGLSNTALLNSTVDAATDLKAEFPQAQIIGLSAVWGDTTTPPQIADINAQVAQAVAQVGGTYLDIGQPLSGHPELMQADDVHPTAAGQVVLASAIQSALDASKKSTEDASTPAPTSVQGQPLAQDAPH